MKKTLLLCSLVLLFLNGCTKNSNPVSDSTQNSPSSQESSDIGSGDLGEEASKESASLPKYDSSGTCYKMETAPAVFDEEAILNYLTYLIPEYDESMVQQVDVDWGKEYSLEVDGVTHKWDIGEGYFEYWNDLAPGGELTEAEALAQSDEFVKHHGFDVAEDPWIFKYESGGYAVHYWLQYEGVPILGDGGIDLPGDDDESFINAPCIQIWVDGNGFHNVGWSNLLECTKVLEEYQGEEDLLSPGKLDAIISMAQKAEDERWEEDGYEHHTEVTEIQFLYIPYEEQGKRILMPAFRVMGLSGGSEIEAELWVIDAVTGRVIVG